MSKERKDFRKYAGWYGSYLDRNTEVLIDLLVSKIKQFDSLIENISGEIELAEDPKEVQSDVILNSIKALIDGVELLETESEGYIWTEEQ